MLLCTFPLGLTVISLNLEPPFLPDIYLYSVIPFSQLKLEEYIFRLNSQTVFIIQTLAGLWSDMPEVLNPLQFVAKIFIS